MTTEELSEIFQSSSKKPWGANFWLYLLHEKISGVCPFRTRAFFETFFRLPWVLLIFHFQKRSKYWRQNTVVTYPEMFSGTYFVLFTYSCLEWFLLGKFCFQVKATINLNISASGSRTVFLHAFVTIYFNFAWNIATFSSLKGPMYVLPYICP